MTKEEAITYANCLKNNYTINFEDMADFCDMAIKALEQEDIIDEIMEEINTPNRGSCDYYIVDRIEEIINKHKGESEAVCI